MKIRKGITEIIVLILVLNFFYEGVYKIAYWSNYSHWLHLAPILRPFWVPLTYAIPLGEVMLSLALLIPSYRTGALYWTIVLQLAFVIWIACLLLLTSYLFWPYHAFWKNPSWIQKALISVGLSWLALTAIILSSDRSYLMIKTILGKLRNNL